VVAFGKMEVQLLKGASILTDTPSQLDKYNINVAAEFSPSFM
jgi:hypothetical protein